MLQKAPLRPLTCELRLHSGAVLPPVSADVLLTRVRAIRVLTVGSVFLMVRSDALLLHRLCNIVTHAAAAELVEFEVDDLPVVVDPEAAVTADAPRLHPSRPDNLSVHFENGDEAAVDLWLLWPAVPTHSQQP